MHVLRYLGLGDAVLRVGVQPKAYVFRLHDTGEMIQTFALSEEHRRQHGAPYIQLHRADLHDLLVDTARELKPDVVHLNRKGVGFVERHGAVELNFAQGAPTRGGMLIGADGLKSVVRAQLFDTVPPTYTGDGVWRVTVSTERLPPEGRLEQVMSMFMGPGGHAVCYYLRGGAVLNFAGTVEAPVSEESWTLKFPWENLKADFAGWHPAIQAIIDGADRNECYRGSLHNPPPIRTWSKGHITILGDAAHPTLPYLAQGAAMAIEDAAICAQCLAHRPDDAESALRIYCSLRRKRAHKVQRLAASNGQRYHFGGLSGTIRNTAMRIMGGTRLLRHY